MLYVVSSCLDQFAHLHNVCVRNFEVITLSVCVFVCVDFERGCHLHSFLMHVDRERQRGEEK